MIRVKDFPDWKVGVHKQGVSSGSVGKFNKVGMLIRVLQCFFPGIIFWSGEFCDL